jgi:alanyl-tRNA synthetase
MTCLLYSTDPYLISFEAKIVEIRGEWIKLDRTAFYPGGGGQDHDTGFFDGAKVTEVRSEGDVLHRVPGHSLREDQTVNGSIDWDRRHDLMKGHTAEHILFATLNKLRPGIELVKIIISPVKKSVVVKGEIDWRLACDAQRMANESIRAGLKTTESWVARDDPTIKEARVKLERIQDDKIRIVQIGVLDRAACAGMHVRNTSEIGALLITKLTSAKPAADSEIEFDVGEKAVRESLDLASIGLQASEAIGSNPKDLVNALTNMKGEMKSLREYLRRLSKDALRSVQPESFNDVKIYSGIFDGVDKKSLTDAANLIVQSEKSVCIFASREERLLLMIACSPDLKIDCIGILTDALKSAGGKGGGKSNFAMGGTTSTDMAEIVFASALDIVRETLSISERSR